MSCNAMLHQCHRSDLAGPGPLPKVDQPNLLMYKTVQADGSGMSQLDLAA